MLGGFGTYKVNGFAGVEAIKSALEVGYRPLDSAFNYENEGVVGKAIRESEVPREDIIVASKLPGRHTSTIRHASRSRSPWPAWDSTTSTCI